MRRSLLLMGVAALAVLLTTSAYARNRGVTFTGVGFIENPGPYPASAVWAMNPQGTVFMVSPTYWGIYCFEWTREGGWGREIGQSNSVCRISANGTIMGEGLVPDSDPPYGSAGTWAGAPNLWDPIPFPPDYEPCGAPGLNFYDMGGDGDFATGLTWYANCGAAAFRWDKKTNTTVNLGSPNGDSSRGNAISDDGATVVGWGRMLFGDWRGARWHNGTWSWIDGQGNIEPRVCNVTGKSCTYDGDDPTYGCPQEYVDDAHCELASCVANVCVGGPNAGNNCDYQWDCAGYCVGGPSNGDSCTDDYYCPDTQVCVPNPAWSDAAYKGEARDISASGHIVGKTFNYDWNLPEYLSGWRRNPNGSFTEIPTAPSFPDAWEPFQISADGKTVVGIIGNPWWGAIPAFWNEGTGTQDLQLFLVGQGLDELYFWYLTQLNDVSADGTVIAGKGYNPDGWQEGFIVDMKKLWVCHAPPGNTANARTLGIAFQDVGDHLAHGDFLGTCEFVNSGGLARAAELRQRLNDGFSPDTSERIAGGEPNANLFMPSRSMGAASWNYAPRKIDQGLDRNAGPRRGGTRERTRTSDRAR